MATVGEWLVEALEAYGIDTVFGIPGVHTVELYRGLARSGLRHVTPRHEQGAGFMADGYYRATGRVAAAFVITGPGVTNILTPMAQAYADSVPMLVVSSVNRRRSLGLGGGDLHEIRNQSLVAAQAAAFSHTVTDPAQLPEVLARAWAVFDRACPRPVHIEVPLDLFAEPAPEVSAPLSASNTSTPVGGQYADAMALLEHAERPVLLIGGGCRTADVRDIARHLDAPAVMTVNARGKMSNAPLRVPASPSLSAVRDLVATADVVLAIGTEMGRTDYDMYDLGGFYVPGTLIRIDIDAGQITRNARPDIALVADARAGISGLLRHAGSEQSKQGADRAEAARNAALLEIGEAYRKTVAFLDLVHETLPGVPLVGDSTQAIYAGNLYYDPAWPNLWFNASTGYGALGYGLPAAIGAARGLGTPVVCICGDGGVQFSLAELGTAVEEELPVVLLIWDNKGYGEIKSYMVQNQIAPVGVDLHTPDFIQIGQAYGAAAERLEDLTYLPEMLRTAAARRGPSVIVFDEAVVLGAG